MNTERKHEFQYEEPELPEFMIELEVDGEWIRKRLLAANRISCDLIAHRLGKKLGADRVFWHQVVGQ